MFTFVFGLTCFFFFSSLPVLLSKVGSATVLKPKVNTSIANNSTPPTGTAYWEWERNLSTSILNIRRIEFEYASRVKFGRQIELQNGLLTRRQEQGGEKGNRIVRNELLSLSRGSSKVNRSDTKEMKAVGNLS